MRTIGKYEIVAEVGRGAMGEVYKARDPLIDRPVALKVITRGLAGRPDLLERFYQEARSAGSLQHPNIVTVYELGKEGELPFIAMEYVDGESLEKIIGRREPLPLTEKVGYVLEICRALECAHKHGVVHRDIKPGNVMVSVEGTVKVVDFGTARLVNASITRTGTLIGTLAYMSPQQIRGEHADEQSDIWAVGVVFHELLSYRRPFLGNSPAELVAAIISQEPPLVTDSAPDIPGDVQAILTRMLQKDAGSRYRSMEDAVLDLAPVWRRLQRARAASLVEESQRLGEAGDFRRMRQFLREALRLDSGREDAKSLLELVNREVRRQEAQPRVHEQVAKAKSLLDSGRWPQAAAEAKAALDLDSTCVPARELLATAEKALGRTREIERLLHLAKQRMAAGAIAEADQHLDSVFFLDPHNREAGELRAQIREEIARREKRKRSGETLRRARELWSQHQYEECVTLLFELQKETPDDAEAAKLLDAAEHDRAEQSKWQAINQARELLAAANYGDAKALLDKLIGEFPGDRAIQNMLTLAAGEQEAQERQARLQSELTALRALVAEGKHAEALQRGERILGEFPGEFELAELLNFARAELRRAAHTRNLEERLAKTRGLFAKGAFEEAIRAAEQGLADAPGNAELIFLRDAATEKRNERQRREELHKRIREIKAKINRNELTDAVALARETVAALGHDTDVSQLLQAAEVERKLRDKKTEEQVRVEAVQTLLEAGKTAEATLILERELHEQLQDASGPPPEPIFTDAGEKQRQAPQAMVAAAGAPGVSESRPPKTLFSATSMSTGRTTALESQFAREHQAARAESLPAAPQPEIFAPEIPKDSQKDLAEARTASGGGLPAGRKWLVVGIGGIAVAAMAGAGIYLATSRSTAQRSHSAGKETQATEAAVPSGPVANPPGEEQRQLLERAEQMLGAEDFAGAQQTLDQGVKLGGPLTPALLSLESQLRKAQDDQAAKAALQADDRLWKQSLAAYQQDRLDDAARGFQRLLRSSHGIHQSEAGEYLKTQIPEARRADQLLSYVKPLVDQANDLPGLQEASQELQQAIAVGGPRAGDLEHLQMDVKSALDDWNSFEQHVKEYNAGQSDPSALRRVQAEFRGLERARGTVGREASQYAEQRIPADLERLESAINKPKSPPLVPATPQWSATVVGDSSLALENHLLPEQLIASGAAKHGQLQLRLTIDKHGKVANGWLVSGDPELGNGLVKAARKTWHFNKPAGPTSILVTVEFH